MTNYINATAGCLLVGDYVDEAESPTTLATCRGEVFHLKVVANYLDLWRRDDGMTEVTSQGGRLP